MYRRIMIVVDDTPASRAAIDEGTSLAARHGAEAVYFALMPAYPVAVADELAIGAVASEDFHKSALAKADAVLSDAVSAAQRAGVFARATHSPQGGDARCVVEGARRRRCDLIVVGSEGRNAVMRLLTGSLVPALITASPLPVLVCKESKAARSAAH